MLLLKCCTERHNSSLVSASGGFDEMLAATQSYYVFGGKGGVGKTSMAASLAVKFANHGEPTLIASTALSRSLGDVFEQVSASPRSKKNTLFTISAENLACSVYRI